MKKLYWKLQDVATKMHKAQKVLYLLCFREAQARAERERDSAKPPAIARSIKARSASAIARSLKICGYETVVAI